MQESVLKKVSISFVAMGVSQAWSRRTLNRYVMRFVLPLYRSNDASRQEYGKIGDTAWKRRRDRTEGVVNKYFPLINALVKRATGEKKTLDRDQSKRKWISRKGESSWSFHGPSRIVLRGGSSAGTGEGNARGKIEASRHPIFWSHFTKSRSYFTIPLVAGTMLVCVPFSIRSRCTPKLSIRGSRFHLKFVTWLGATTIFLLLFPLYLLFFSPSPLLSTIFETARGIETRSFVRNLTINGANHGNIYRSANQFFFYFFFLFSFYSFFFSFFFFCFFSRCSFFLFFFFPLFQTTRYIVVGSNGSNRDQAAWKFGRFSDCRISRHGSTEK